MHYRVSIALFVAVILLSYATDFFLASSIFGSKYRILLAPGVIIHELAHGFACILTGAKVSEMSLFEKEGGHVKHTKSKIPILGPIIISLAPLIVGIIAIYFISRYLSTSGLDTLKSGYSVKSMLLANVAIVKSLAHLSWKNGILLYITVSVVVTMLPSRQDILHAFLPLLILITAFLVASKYSHIYLPTTSFNLLLFTTINLLILVLIFSIILFAITNIFRRS